MRVLKNTSFKIAAFSKCLLALNFATCSKHATDGVFLSNVDFASSDFESNRTSPIEQQTNSPQVKIQEFDFDETYAVPATV